MRLQPPHFLPPLLTGKSENLAKAKTADAAGHLEEIGTGGKTDHGAKILASSGKKSAEMTMTLEGIVIQDCSEATETIIDPDLDPDHHLHEDALLGEMMRIGTERESLKI